MKTASAVVLACALLALGFGLFIIRTTHQPHFLGSVPPSVRLPEVTLVDDRGAPLRFPGFTQRHMRSFLVTPIAETHAP